MVGPIVKPSLVPQISLPQVTRRAALGLALAGTALAPFVATPAVAATLVRTTFQPDLQPISVKDPRFGATGDGTTDDTAAIQAAIDFCFGTSASPNGTSAYLNKDLYFPPGQYKVTSELVFTKVRGAKIFGAGRFVTKIFTTSTTQPIFRTNGFEYCQVDGIYFVGVASTPRLLDISWDGSGSVNLQSNTFSNLYFETCVIGVDIGRGNNMGSENVFLSCVWRSCSTVGLRTSNANALQNTVIGGNISFCGIGIYVVSGSVPNIEGVGFQDQVTVDIQQDNSSGDILNIIGCRTESNNFFYAKSNAVAANLIGCEQRNSSGAFVDARAGGQTSMLGCYSNNGTVRTPMGYMVNCELGLASPFDTTFQSGDNSSHLEVINTWINSKGTLIFHRMYQQTSSGVVTTVDYGAPNFLTKTADFTLTLAHSGFTMGNEGATALVTFTLPDAANAMEFSFIVKDTDGIKVLAVNNDSIRIDGAVSANAGYIQSFTIGSTIKLRSTNGTQWVASEYVGEWGIDS